MNWGIFAVFFLLIFFVIWGFDVFNADLSIKMIGTFAGAVASLLGGYLADQD